MIIQSLTEVDGNSVSSQDLLEYLSQIVILLTDDQIEQSSRELEQYKLGLEESKTRLESIKVKILATSKEYKRLKVLNNVLSKIDALRKEGVLVRQNKVKILNLLSNIENKSISQLKVLENKLSVYVPDNPKVVY